MYMYVKRTLVGFGMSLKTDEEAFYEIPDERSHKDGGSQKDGRSSPEAPKRKDGSEGVWLDDLIWER